ncbi:hypothetical protein MTO96_012057 [Rhipicephalus appendiculatus]
MTSPVRRGRAGHATTEAPRRTRKKKKSKCEALAAAATAALVARISGALSAARALPATTTTNSMPWRRDTSRYTDAEAIPRSGLYRHGLLSAGAFPGRVEAQISRPTLVTAC